MTTDPSIFWNEFEKTTAQPPRAIPSLGAVRADAAQQRQERPGARLQFQTPPSVGSPPQAERREPRLVFKAPPALPTAPSFAERLEEHIQPFRESVESARAAYEAAAADAAAKDALRTDIERAVASVRNVETTPRSSATVIRPRDAMRMSDQQWESLKQRAMDGEIITGG